jgi:hypothetical protein
MLLAIVVGARPQFIKRALDHIIVHPGSARYDGIRTYLELKPKPVDAPQFYGNGQAAIRIAHRTKEFLQKAIN